MIRHGNLRQDNDDTNQRGIPKANVLSLGWDYFMKEKRRTVNQTSSISVALGCWVFLEWISLSE